MNAALRERRGSGDYRKSVARQAARRGPARERPPSQPSADPRVAPATALRAASTCGPTVGPGILGPSFRRGGRWHEPGQNASRGLSTILRTLLAAALAASPILAQGLASPFDLQPGEQYRILAVTDSGRDALSADIADSDAFVRADVGAYPALLQLAANWQALVSTPSVSASVHTGTAGGGGVPIYRLDGARVFDDFAHMWGTATRPPLVPPDIAAGGARTSRTTWTGTSSTAQTDAALGDPSGLTRNGVPVVAHTVWIDGLPFAQSETRARYALSDVISVPYLAGETLRVGVPANPEVFLTGRTSKPVVGQTWDPIVDHTNLLGLELFTQAASVDASAVLSATNALDITIGLR